MQATHIRATREHLDRQPTTINAAAIGGAIGGGVATGLWTWAAVVAFAAGGGWTVAGCFFALFAVGGLITCLTNLFMIFA